MTTKRKPKVVKTWGGFVDGKLHQPTSIFTTKKYAKLLYDDVRRVEIREVKK